MGRRRWWTCKGCASAGRPYTKMDQLSSIVLLWSATETISVPLHKKTADPCTFCKYPAALLWHRKILCVQSSKILLDLQIFIWSHTSCYGRESLDAQSESMAKCSLHLPSSKHSALLVNLSASCNELSLHVHFVGCSGSRTITMAYIGRALRSLIY